MTFASQKTLFFFLVMVYDRVGDGGDKHSYKVFGLWRPSFHAISHLRIEANQFFMNTM